MSKFSSLLHFLTGLYASSKALSQQSISKTLPIGALGDSLLPLNIHCSFMAKLHLKIIELTKHPLTHTPENHQPTCSNELQLYVLSITYPIYMRYEEINPRRVKHGWNHPNGPWECKMNNHLCPCKKSTGHCQRYELLTTIGQLSSRWWAVYANLILPFCDFIFTMIRGGDEGCSIFVSFLYLEEIKYNCKYRVGGSQHDNYLGELTVLSHYSLHVPSHRIPRQRNSNSFSSDQNFIPW